MGRARTVLFVLLLWPSLRWIPSTWCAREADALWSDDRAMQQALRRGADHWRAQALVADDFMTSDARFDGEWMFGAYMMMALGYAQSARAHPEWHDAHVAAVDDCIEHMLRPEVRAFDRRAWRSDPLDDLGSPRGHAAYLGYLNVVLSLRRVLDADSPHAALNDAISAHLRAALAASPIGLASTYPGEVYPVDNTAVLASLALHERASGEDHGEVLVGWAERFERWRDPETGLLIQSVTEGGATVDGPRGSGTGLAVYFLSLFEAERSGSLYEASRRQLHRAPLGFGVMREYPPGVTGRGDIDSGPVVLGVSISSTGFALAGSRAHGDAEAFAARWATASLFGAPVDRKGARHFALGGPLGDALMFALLTARPAGEWTAARSTTQRGPVPS